MEIQLYFYKPMMLSYMNELESVATYYRKAQSAFEFSEEDVQREVVEILSNANIPEDTDPDAIAETMEVMEVELYESHLMMKSNHLFITISMLAHMWEQQIIKFVKKELYDSSGKNFSGLSYQHAKEVIETCGVEITNRSSWKKIKELRHLVNTIKHAEGYSAKELRKLRPDFFATSGFSKDDIFDILELNGSVLLNPYSLNVSESDLTDYIQATKEFWGEMPEKAFFNLRTQTSYIVQEEL
ncbi:hypothetical protein [Bacillus thuringiensis]|uniref:hypothetical protein n=1 Tax=Bacillus thuringiensis TaxID=1428 RepID=UPI000BFDF60D|nr:hypothetical protein [Bacillus thuringiensis]PGT57935.1 hypothetical protein COD16_22395 [Bacillus thuringiensis]